MCYLNFIALKFVTISEYMRTILFFCAFSLKYISLHKKNNSPPFLLLNICKFSYFVGYRCLNLSDYYFCKFSFKLGWPSDIEKVR